MNTKFDKLFQELHNVQVHQYDHAEVEDMLNLLMYEIEDKREQLKRAQSIAEEHQEVKDLAAHFGIPVVEIGKEYGYNIRARYWRDGVFDEETVREQLNIWRHVEVDIVAVGFCNSNKLNEQHVYNSLTKKFPDCVVEKVSTCSSRWHIKKKQRKPVDPLKVCPQIFEMFNSGFLYVDFTGVCWSPERLEIVVKSPVDHKREEGKYIDLSSLSWAKRLHKEGYYFIVDIAEKKIDWEFEPDYSVAMVNGERMSLLNIRYDMCMEDMQKEITIKLEYESGMLGYGSLTKRHCQEAIKFLEEKEELKAKYNRKTGEIKITYVD